MDLGKTRGFADLDQTLRLPCERAEIFLALTNAEGRVLEKYRCSM